MSTIELDDQRSDEDIVIESRMHPWVLAKAGVVTILLTALVVLAFLIWGASQISFIILGIIVLMLAVYLLTKVFTYRNTTLVVTNQRVIYIYQKSLFRRIVQEVELDNIFNLQYKIEGVFKSLLNFGNLDLSSVGDESNRIIAYDIENPAFVHEKISDLRSKYHKSSTLLHSDKKVVLR